MKGVKLLSGGYVFSEKQLVKAETAQEKHSLKKFKKNLTNIFKKKLMNSAWKI